MIDDRRLKTLLRELEHELGPLDTRELGPAVRLQALSVDLVRASSSQVFREALARFVDKDGWRIPTLEMLLVLKFMSAVSPWRGRDRARQDVLDLARVYGSVDPADVDRELMRALAGHAYPGAERELDSLLDKIDRDEPLTL